MQEVLYVILILEAQFIGLFVLFLIVGNVWEWADKKLNPHYPFCDIDPRCHIAFAWDKNCNGWIGNHLVVPNVQDHLTARQRR